MRTRHDNKMHTALPTSPACPSLCTTGYRRKTFITAVRAERYPIERGMMYLLYIINLPGCLHDLCIFGYYQRNSPMFDPQPDWFPVLCPISCARVPKATPTGRHRPTFYGLQ